MLSTTISKLQVSIGKRLGISRYIYIYSMLYSIEAKDTFLLYLEYTNPWLVQERRGQRKPGYEKGKSKGKMRKERKYVR